MQPAPLRLTSSRAFPRAADDLLALAGEVLSAIWRRDGRLQWQFPQGVTHRPPPAMAAFFTALGSYQTGAYDGGGTMVHWTASVQLDVTATGFEREGLHYYGFALDFAVANGDSTFELLAMVACVQLTRRLLERQWITADQAPGFWQMSNRGWSDHFIARAPQGGEFDLMLVLEKQGLFPGFDLRDPETVRQAMSEAVWMRRLFDR